MDSRPHLQASAPETRAEARVRNDRGCMLDSSARARAQGSVPALAELGDLSGGVSGVDDEDRDLRRLKDTVAHAAEQ